MSKPRKRKTIGYKFTTMYGDVPLPIKEIEHRARILDRAIAAHVKRVTKPLVEALEKIAVEPDGEWGGSHQTIAKDALAKFKGGSK